MAGAPAPAHGGVHHLADGHIQNGIAFLDLIRPGDGHQVRPGGLDPGKLGGWWVGGGYDR